MPARNDSKGVVATLLAQVTWGGVPIYLHLLTQSGSVEIIAHRVWWTLVFCILAITIMGGWAKARRVLSTRKTVIALLGAGVLVTCNWLIFVIAVQTDRLVDAALGYFILPLITVILAVIFLGERLRAPQVFALSIAVVAVIVMSVGAGQFPWLGLGLALCFAFYSLVKAKVAVEVPPVVGLGIETTALAPLCLGYILFLECTGQGGLSTGPTYFALLMAAGLVTGVPLLFFAIGTARVPLVTIAFSQYLTPVFQFLLGVYAFSEPMPLVRWVGFVLVWISLTIHSWDMVRQSRTAPTAATQIATE